MRRKFNYCYVFLLSVSQSEHMKQLTLCKEKLKNNRILIGILMKSNLASNVKRLDFYFDVKLSRVRKINSKQIWNVESS